jgi:hypothetical protein
MGVSYKTRWQEADKQVQQLQTEAAKLRDEHAAMKDEVIRLNALLAAALDPEVRKAMALRRAEQIVDLAGIARHMRVERFTPQQWRQRKLLPPVDFPKIDEPLWYVTTLLEKFVHPTRRIWYDDEALSLVA